MLSAALMFMSRSNLSHASETDVYSLTKVLVKNLLIILSLNVFSSSNYGLLTKSNQKEDCKVKTKALLKSTLEEMVPKMCDSS